MTESGKATRSLILLLIIITSFINPFLGAAINIALPSISAEFSMGAVGMSWVAMSFLLSSAVFLVPLGKLADIRGRKRIFFLGNVILTLSSILCALSTSGTMLILLRGIQGIGSAMVFGTGVAIITSVYPPKERGKAIGITVTSVYVGLSLAPFLGGMLTQYLGWRSIFYATVPFVLSMSAFMYGFSKLPDKLAIVLVSFGLLGMAAFVVLEIRVRFPVFNMVLFSSNRLFALSNLAALINYATTFAITFLLSLYLQYILGMSPRDAGMILITQPILMAIVASISGKLSDTRDPRILASMGMGIIVIGLVMLTFLSEKSSIPFLLVILALVGFGFGMFSSPNTNAIMGSVDKKFLGVASATVGTMRLTGQMMSMGIATLVLQLFMGNNPITAQNAGDFMNSMRSTFLIFVVLCVIGVFASLARGKRVPK